MPTLNIAGKRVKVGDEFLKLSPEDQQKTVNEIAASFGPAPAAAASPGPAVAPDGLVPGSKEYATWAAEQARAGRALPPVSDLHPGEHGFMDQVAAGTTAAANAIPIVGPKALEGIQNLRGAVQHMTPEQVKAETAATEAANPTAAVAGSITGRVLPFVAAAGVPGLATVLGLDATAPIAASMILGGASQKGIDYVDNLVRGQDPSQKVIDAGPIQMTSGDIAGLGGALGPVVGPLAGATVKGLGEGASKIGRAFEATFNPGAAASKRAGTEIAADLAAGNHMAGADLAAARQNGDPLINADIFGPKTKGLLRDSLPADPAAMDAVQTSLAERAAIGARKDRAAQFFNDVTGGDTNFQAAQDAVNAGRAGTNNAAYEAAYGAAPKTGIWTPKIAAMMHEAASDPNSALRQAIAMTASTGKDEAVAAAGSGVTRKFPVRNPFRFNADGSYSLTKGPVAPHTVPTLQFWDHVQRNLGKLASKAGGYDATLITDTQKALQADLDTAVPGFQTARQGAAKFFDANDALEAGQKFAMSNTDPSVAAAAAAKFSPAEKRLFGVGGLSKINNIVQQAGSPTTIDRLLDPGGKAMQQINVLLDGWPPHVRAQVPAFMRVQQAMADTSKVIKAASSTKLARQLGQVGAQSGVGSIIGGVAGGVSGGNLNPLSWDFGRVTKTAVLGAALAAGAKLLGKTVNQNVMKRVVQMLASDDPTAIRNAIAYATKNPQAGEALRAISHGVRSFTQPAVVGSGMLAAPANAAPVNLTVNGGDLPEGTTP